MQNVWVNTKQLLLIASSGVHTELASSLCLCCWADQLSIKAVSESELDKWFEKEREAGGTEEWACAGPLHIGYWYKRPVGTYSHRANRHIRLTFGVIMKGLAQGCCVYVGCLSLLNWASLLMHAQIGTWLLALTNSSHTHARWAQLTA